MRLLINLLWIYPAIIMTVWTLLVFIAARVAPLDKPAPLFGNQHIMLFMLNPKDRNLYQRPSVAAAALFLLLGVIPIVNTLMLAVHLGYIWIALSVKADKRSKQGSPS